MPVSGRLATLRAPLAKQTKPTLLHDAGDAVALHGQVVDMDGVHVVELGGHFVGPVWMPPAEPAIRSRDVALKHPAFQCRGGQRPLSTYLAAIYPAEVARLGKKRADILVTHEAPSCHHRGFAELDKLARSLRVSRAFHGHHHDDLTVEYAKQRERLRFDAVALRYCAIKNGLGEKIFSGEKGW